MEFSYNACCLYSDLAAYANYGRSAATQRDMRILKSYSAIIKCNIKIDEPFEVPGIMSTQWKRACIYEKGKSYTIAFPLYTKPIPYNKNTADSILKTFTRGDSRLVSVYTSKGELYYGNNSLILDSEFNPLFMVVYKHMIDEETHTDSIVGVTIHVSPEVFTDDSKLINRLIAKKLIPFYLNKTGLCSCWSSNTPVKVVVDECEDFFVKAHKPEDSLSPSEVIKENFDEIISQILHDAGRDF